MGTKIYINTKHAWISKGNVIYITKSSWCCLEFRILLNFNVRPKLKFCFPLGDSQWIFNLCRKKSILLFSNQYNNESTHFKVKVQSCIVSTWVTKKDITNTVGLRVVPAFSDVNFIDALSQNGPLLNCFTLDSRPPEIKRGLVFSFIIDPRHQSGQPNSSSVS